MCFDKNFIENIQNMQEESVYRKIEEEKEKKFLIEINSLKEELENLREMEQERETQSQNEKTLLKKINERFQLGLEKIHDEKQIFIDQINSLKDRLQNNEKMMREREKQFSVEMYKHYNN